MTVEHEQIKQYWENQASKYKGISLATSPDTIAFEMEINQMKLRIPPGSKVLDIGCGNGVKGIELTKSLPIEYCGVDFAEQMVLHANDLLQRNEGSLTGSARFLVGNILEKETLPAESFDLVLTDRCLINLQTFENQVKAIRNIHSVLRDKGKYLMFENSVQALNNLNEARQRFALPDIPVRWHNIYVDETKLFSEISEWFEVKEVVPFASSYYLISRTLNALLTPAGQEPDYMSELNQLAAKLPAAGDFSPVKLFVLEKK